MSGEQNLDVLLGTMNPDPQEGDYVFQTSRQGFSREAQDNAVMVFRETEGMTLIIQAEIAEALQSDSPRWSMITLTVHSDLAAVGFLAAITQKLAVAGISVNAVSAFYHDHLFVPKDKLDEAMAILRSFAKP